jgi:hypothetical protein
LGFPFPALRSVYFKVLVLNPGSMSLACRFDDATDCKLETAIRAIAIDNLKDGIDGILIFSATVSSCGSLVVRQFHGRSYRRAAAYSNAVYGYKFLAVFQFL